MKDTKHIENKILIIEENEFKKYTDIIHNDTNMLSLKKAHNLYKSLEVWFKICKKFGIESSLWGGSLLGYVRHKSIIPWDDDCDVCIFEKHLDLVYSKTFIKELNRWGFNLIIEKNPFVLHIYRESNISNLSKKYIRIPNGEPLFRLNNTKFNNSLPFIKSGLLDIFIFRNYEKDLFRPIDFNKYKGKDHLNFNEIYPLITVCMGGRINVQIFNKSEKYLKRLYGENALTQGIITDFHDYTDKNIKQGNKNIIKYNLHTLFLPCYIFIDYWENIYCQNTIDVQQSLFAEFVSTYNINNKSDKKNLLNLGCGNNRDDYFFVSQGFNVTGVDYASNNFSSKNLNIIKSDIIYFIDKGINKFNIIYSRFVLHSLTDEDEYLLLSKLHQFISFECVIYLEFRTIIDELYGKGIEISNNEYIFNNHYRRFIILEEFKKKVINIGFKIIYERTSNTFARYKHFKPTVCRIILTKKK